jgi:hypothetical protein
MRRRSPRCTSPGPFAHCGASPGTTGAEAFDDGLVGSSSPLMCCSSPPPWLAPNRENLLSAPCHFGSPWGQRASGRAQLRSEGGANLVGNGHSYHSSVARDRVARGRPEHEAAEDLPPSLDEQVDGGAGQAHVVGTPQLSSEGPQGAGRRPVGARTREKMPRCLATTTIRCDSPPAANDLSSGRRPASPGGRQ